MIIPELKRLFSSDIERPDLPIDQEDCVVVIDAAIGPKGEKGEELFSFVVATPKGLSREFLPRWGRGLLVVSEFSWIAVEHALQRLMMHAQRKTWPEVAAALNHELRSEFDNYQAPKKSRSSW